VTAHRCAWWAILLGTVVPAALLGAFEAPAICLVVLTTSLGLLGGGLLSGARYPWEGWVDNAVASSLVMIGAPALGWRTFAVALLLVGTSTTFVRRVRARSGGRPATGKQDRVVSGRRSTYVGVCLGTMSGRELCQAWRASFVRVKSADLRDRRLQAGVRKSLLDELERRDADRFRAWLDRSPSAASDPLWVVSLPSASGVHRPRHPASGDEPVG